MPVSFWNLKYIFCLKSITFTMTLSISTCRKLKFIHRTRSVITEGPFQELFNKTRCTTCNRFYFLSSVVTFDAFYISNQKQKCTACVEIWCSLFLQNSNNKDLQKFAKNWKHSHVPINEKVMIESNTDEGKCTLSQCEIHGILKVHWETWRVVANNIQESKWNYEEKQTRPTSNNT